ncbi:hypothetical protein CHS0354_039361 [Potamilus streckersoni]|uniref:ubiquitinyl hydrolase 1 n=1 Tax=Potamilus streckersoni TaxID=2493646 RepID=A0AAE0T3R1_9BIVA|nr:hypothetical protein CHS0354_039361 [Potamilus streckersoni]
MEEINELDVMEDGNKEPCANGEAICEENMNRNSSSKRKKEVDSDKEKTSPDQKRLRQEWSQTDNTVALTLRIDECPVDQLKDIDVEFTDKSVTLTLPDNRKWSWTLAEEIVREESRVKVSKKHKIVLQMKKKNEIHWKTYEAIPTLPSSSSSDESVLSGTLSDTLHSDLDITIASSVNTCSEDSGMDNISEPIKSVENQIPEEKIQKDEPVFELQHIKHDFIEKDDTFTVHIYVKEINKAAVEVNFEPHSLTVRFHTGDKKFLQLHKMNEDTVFLWKIQLRGEIIPEKSKYKITSTLIDITLGKKLFTRWGDLEALKRKSPSENPSQTDTWINISQVKPAAMPSSRHSPSDENQARKERDIKKEKSEINKGKENKTNQNEANKENVAQKPTCKVSPLNKNSHTAEIVVSPGMTGLDNLGNTCFMNSVLQCLANTREFRDIFLDSSFQSDLNTSNSLGTGGKLAICFAVLMKVLWSGHHYSYAPSKLKTLVALKASQFTGFAQHDAQEFMAFLLDGLHEDLNRVQKKPYTQTVEDGGRPDEVVASEAWEVYKKRNDSFIVDMFQGQYKSKLVCPECGKVSITFDPFLYLSLPLPKKQRLLPVTFFSKDITYKKPVRYMLKLAKDSTVENLKELLYRKTGVHPTNIRVFEAVRGKFQRIFPRGSDLGSVQSNDVIIACEVLSKDVAREEVYEINVIQRTVMPNQLPTRCFYCKRQCPPDEKLKRCTKCFKVGYCNQQCQKNHWQTHRPCCKPSPDPVGCPFIISIPQSRATFSRISKLMEAYARYSVDVFQPPVITDNMPSMSGQPSTSSLSSSSSQSSGSLSSLDSQSSYSSTCTITADDTEQILEDTEDNSLEKLSDTSHIPRVRSEQDLSLSSQTGSFSSLSVNSLGPSSVEMESSLAMDEVDKNTQSETSKSNNATATEMELNQDQDKILTASSTEPRQSNVNPVLGIQTGETGHNSPPFFLKPVAQDGLGLSGQDGERLKDEGDAPLDLSGLRFLSMDWKNNEKNPGYVLVQTKELEVENDESMMTASLDVNTAHLSQCLELFTEPEVLSQEEAWYCPQCKEHREATKQMSIWKLPHTLIVQLKRFSFRNFILRDKIDKMVEFPVRGLDLSSYYVGTRPANEPPPIYDLYAVVNHHGGILGGHYTAYVRCADPNDYKKNLVGWRLCDDSRVSNISHEKNVVTRAAYLLFFRRREPFILPKRPIPSPESDNKEEEEEKATKEKELEGKEEDIPQLGFPKEMSVELAKHEELPEIEQTSDDKLAPLFSDNIEDNDCTVDNASASSTVGYTDMDTVD